MYLRIFSSKDQFAAFRHPQSDTWPPTNQAAILSVWQMSCCKAKTNSRRNSLPSSTPFCARRGRNAVFGETPRGEARRGVYMRRVWELTVRIGHKIRLWDRLAVIR